MKKRYLIILITSWALLIGLIPMNLYIVSMPDIVIWAAVLTVLILTVLFIVRSGAKKAGKAVIPVLSVLLSASVVLGGVVCNPYWNSTFLHSDSVPYSLPYDTVLTRKQAQEDLAYAMRYLSKLHPACYGGLPDDVEKRYNEVKAEIDSSDGITVNELYIKIETIFALLHDGHTMAAARYADARFLKHWYSWDTAGYALKAVNGQTVDELLDSLAPYVSFDQGCTSGERVSLQNDLLCREYMYAMGFNIEDGITYTFENEEGDIEEATYYDDDYVTLQQYYEYNGIDRGTSDDETFVSYEIDEERSLAILTLNECIINDTYRDTVRAMFTEVRDLGIRNVAVDVRNNSGGNDGVVSEFFRYLDIDSYKMVTCDHRLGFLMFPEGPAEVTNDRYTDLTFTGDLYILTTPITFSSAMIFAQYVKDNDLGTIIGQAPGNDPNGYGDVAFFSLPNSGIFMQISTKKWYRADRDCTDLLVEPDIERNVRLYTDAMDALYEAIEDQ
ncbi:MAG: hypothetical protein J5685_10590 [Clostridiales bacterium]|nr:hypothetical protein [Clostridiales bacterium]